jgi:hypothetical protein
MRRDSAIANGDRIYKIRFVDAVKNHGTPKELPKSRFVPCGYNDKEAKSLLTKAPTVSKNSTRVLLALAASCPGHAVRCEIYLRHTPNRELMCNAASSAKPLRSWGYQMNMSWWSCGRCMGFPRLHCTGI